MKTPKVTIDIHRNLVSIDGMNFSISFFETLHNPDPNKLYRLRKDTENGVVLEPVSIQDLGFRATRMQ